MTVKELIEKLKEFDESYELLLDDYNVGPGGVEFDFEYDEELNAVIVSY